MVDDLFRRLDAFIRGSRSSSRDDSLHRAEQPVKQPVNIEFFVQYGLAQWEVIDLKTAEAEKYETKVRQPGDQKAQTKVVVAN